MMPVHAHGTRNGRASDRRKTVEHRQDELGGVPTERLSSLPAGHAAEAKRWEACLYVWDVKGQCWADVSRVLCCKLDRGSKTKFLRWLGCVTAALRSMSEQLPFRRMVEFAGDSCPLILQESGVSAHFWQNLGPRPSSSSAWQDLFELYHVACHFLCCSQGL